MSKSIASFLALASLVCAPSAFSHEIKAERAEQIKQLMNDSKIDFGSGENGGKTGILVCADQTMFKPAGREFGCNIIPVGQIDKPAFTRASVKLPASVAALLIDELRAAFPGKTPFDSPNYWTATGRLNVAPEAGVTFELNPKRNLKFHCSSQARETTPFIFALSIAISEDGAEKPFTIENFKVIDVFKGKTDLTSQFKAVISDDGKTSLSVKNVFDTVPGSVVTVPKFTLELANDEKTIIDFRIAGELQSLAEGTIQSQSLSQTLQCRVERNW